MDYLVKSIKWSEHRGVEVWWGPDENGYVSYIHQAGLYTEEEAKKLERVHGKDVCVAIPFNDFMVEKAIKQVDECINHSNIMINNYKGHIQHEEDEIKRCEKLIDDLSKRLNKR